MFSFKKIVFVVCLALGISNATNASTALSEKLSDGQHVLLMRHADAPGYGDPTAYQIGQCSTQRNLGEYGRKQAKAIGQWLSAQGITSAQVFSSPWCRCLDTAKLLNKGGVVTAPEIGSFFDNRSQEKKQTKELEDLIKAQLAKHPNTPIIFVTHHVNIQGLTGKAVASGDMVLVKVDKNGQYLSHQLYPSPLP
jgi:phosphohistidine phosphatase SixA